jgi:hypothetical protein
MLSGSIPKALGEVRGLETLDLSSNLLSGSIPIELQNLHVLKLLNLSYNDFEGSIPSDGIFHNLSDVHLVGNKKLCLHFACVHRVHRRTNVRFYIIIAVVLTLVISLPIGLLLILYMKYTKVKVTSTTPFEQLNPKVLLKRII